jgi:hypothetical protein
MKCNRKTVLSLSLVAVLATGIATTAIYASGNHGGGMGNQGGMKKMMMQMRGQMMGSHGEAGMMGGGQMGDLSRHHDDGEGAISPEEAHAKMQAMLEEYDIDGNGTLSVGEFEVLNSANSHESMVDRFQMLDSDGDGQVTTDEISTISERMRDMMNNRAGQMGEHGTFGGSRMGAGNGQMMQNHSN